MRGVACKGTENIVSAFVREDDAWESLRGEVVW